MATSIAERSGVLFETVGWRAGLPAEAGLTGAANADCGNGATSCEAPDAEASPAGVDVSEPELAAFFPVCDSAVPTAPGADTADPGATPPMGAAGADEAALTEDNISSTQMICANSGVVRFLMVILLSTVTFSSELRLKACCLHTHHTDVVMSLLNSYTLIPVSTTGSFALRHPPDLGC